MDSCGPGLTILFFLFHFIKNLISNSCILLSPWVRNYIRRDTIKPNWERIQKAKNEDEVWKIVNVITKPKEDKTWIQKEGNHTIICICKNGLVTLEVGCTKLSDLPHCGGWGVGGGQHLSSFKESFFAPSKNRTLTRELG